MQRTYVNELSDGETVDQVFLLVDRQLRANRNADLYLLSQLRDRTGQISGLLWNVSEEAVAHLQPGDYVRVRGKVQLFQGNLQIILAKIERASNESINPEEFIPQSSANTVKQLERLREILLAIPEADLRELLRDFLEDRQIIDGLLKAPAGIRLHHAFTGGLLEHLLTLSETAIRIADLYPKVDFNLVLAGIFLHDLGKIRELAFDTSFSYTDEGQLLGHLVIGVELLNEKIHLFENRTGRMFPRETALRLKHLIISHHGSYEYGSPKLPMTPEAIALHHLDNLDAKTNEFQSLIDSDLNSESNWTPFHANLQRKLFKGGQGHWSG